MRAVSFLAIIGSVFFVSACTERPRPAGPSCGDPGTHTVVVGDGCECAPGYHADATFTMCVADAVSIPDGGVPDAGDVADGASDTSAPDASAAPGTLREVDGSTCAVGCTALGFPCTTTCDGGAGFASYGYYDWDYGFYRGVHQEDLASCDITPAESHTTGGETYELGRLVCCCAIPETSVVSAAAGDDRTCDAICAAAGYGGCAGFHEWPSDEGTGGTLATYERPETGSVTYVVMGCAANPPAVQHIAGADRYLRDYSCACY